MAAESGYLSYVLVSNLTVTADVGDLFVTQALEWRLQRAIGAGVTLKQVSCAGTSLYGGQQRVP